MRSITRAVTGGGAGGSGTIGGTIANTQVAFGTAADTIGGVSRFTYLDHPQWPALLVSAPAAAGNNEEPEIDVTSGVGSISIRSLGSGYTDDDLLNLGSSGLVETDIGVVGGITIVAAAANAPVRIGAGGFSFSNEVIRVLPTGVVAVGPFATASAKDIGFSREAAGVLQINTGTANTYADIKAANFTVAGSAFRSDTTTAHTALFQAYDVDDATYRTFATLTNANTPTFVITPPSGGTVTVNATTLQQGGNAISLGGALTTAAGKTFTVNNSLTLAGTDSTTMTFPSTSATIARTDAGNTFTGNQTINESAGGSGLTLTGATQTTSQPVLSATQTWNAGAVAFTGMLLNVTNTASATSSKLLDLQVGATSIFRAMRVGGLLLQGATSNDLVCLGNVSGGTSYTPQVVCHTNATGQVWVLGTDGSDNSLIKIGNAGVLQWQTTKRTDAGAASIILTRDADGVLAQRNTTNAQGINLYNTYTSATSFERLMLDWQTTANTAMIYTQKGSGGGTARVLQLNYGGTTTSAISVPITSGAITFGGALTTTGASATIASGTGIPAGGTAGTGYVFSSTANFGVFFGSGAPTLSAAQGSLYLRSDGSSTTTRAYINTDGATTWTAITTAA